MKPPRIITVDARDNHLLEVIDAKGQRHRYRISFSGQNRERARLERPSDWPSVDRRSRG